MVLGKHFPTKWWSSYLLQRIIASIKWNNLCKVLVIRWCNSWCCHEYSSKKVVQGRAIRFLVRNSARGNQDRLILEYLLILEYMIFRSLLTTEVYGCMWIFLEELIYLLIRISLNWLVLNYFLSTDFHKGWSLCAQIGGRVGRGGKKDQKGNLTTLTISLRLSSDLVS